ncbi:ABC transporter permease [Demequina aurantiaca]|uniref:ABC transporter permease n=1 Tax=Demequina aurantiaca TaxID=676200 RepID=UPI000780F6AD|nr:ABC transporter permease [Demequina aurantiaca]
MTDTDYEKLATDAGLERVGARAPLGEYLKELWARRHFAYTLARYRIQATMSENRLGLGWIVIRPIFTAIIFGTIFGVIMSSDSRPDNFVPFLVVGVFIFEFFSKSFSAGAKSITSNASLVRSLNFPRMLLPIAAVIQQVFELVPIIAVMTLIIVGFGEPITWAWLLVPVILALMTMFNLGIALISARLTVHLRDVTQIIPLLTRILFYSSGIFYSLEQVLEDKPAWVLKVVELNPIHDFITLVRAQMVTGNEASPTMWWVVIGSSITMLVVGVIFFWRAEERYGRD